MNKQDLVSEVVKRTDIAPSDVGLMLEATLGAIRDTVVRGQRVTLSGFGTFERKRRAPRLGRNPRSGVEVPIAATYVAAFRPGGAFKEAVVARRRKPSGRKPTRKRAGR